MDKCWPALPVNEGVQSNCWKLVLVLGYLGYGISMIVNLASGQIWPFFQNIFATILFTMFQYHSLYYTIEITEEMVHIKGGPCQWCAEWNNKDDIKHWISAAWCFSSQIMKSDIKSIETRIVNYWPDWFPRYYCSPIMWCCCHKSYSGWYFPFCCSDINVSGLCDGDVGPVTNLKYVQFNLSEKATDWLFPQRCTPNLFSACTYNRISYVLRDPSVVDQLKQCGYTVLELSGGGGSAPVSTVQSTTDTSDMGGQTATASAPAEEPAPGGDGEVPTQVSQP